MQAASNLFKQGRKTDAARLYVACGEGFARMQEETQDDPMFVEALKARVQDCVQKAEICRTGKPVTEVEPGKKLAPKSKKLGNQAQMVRPQAQ